MAHSPHRRRKGCGVCKPHKMKDHGRAVRDTAATVRFTGKRRRIRRGEIPADQRP